MADHNELGKKGEEAAQQHLVDNEYEIRHKNWRFTKKEIDIIAQKDNVLVVVEVKTRTSDYFEKPQEAVTRKKQKFIIKAADAYVEEFDIDMEVRFDIVSVTFKGNQFEIEHIEDAFQPSLL